MPHATERADQLSAAVMNVLALGLTVVVTLLPLLAILWFAHDRLGLFRRPALALAIALSTAWFPAIHLPTYDWSLVQCFGVFGSSRLVLTAAYLVTRNLWVSTGAHILNDWSLFALSLVIPHPS